MFERAPKKSDNTKYDEVLGVPKNASQDDLKKAYEQAAIKNHLDKGGDPEKCGEDALKEGMVGDSRIRPLKVCLEDLYNGTSKKQSISRTVICWKCKGSGVSMACKECRGSGMKLCIKPDCPSILEQMNDPVYLCHKCNGTGETIDSEHACPRCKGNKVFVEKVLKVVVEKGMQDEQKIPFHWAADQPPDTVTADIVFVLKQMEHPKFKRMGDDLFVEHTLSLTEALGGFQFVLTLLDNRQLLVKSEPGEVVKHDSFHAKNDEGMPMYKRPFMKGKLYIHFTVDFPDTLSPEQNKAIEAVLPPMKISDMGLDE